MGGLISIDKREFLSVGLEKLMRSNGHLPPLSALRAFEAAARLQSFSKAADELSVTPAAISHQIAALEADLGVSLFNRRNRAVELTASARVLLPGLTEAFAGIQSSVRRLRAHNDTGTLTVTASPSIAGKWLGLRLPRFQEQHPEVDVRISATDEVVDLTRGDFDIAIRYGRGIYPGLDVDLLFTNEVFPACSPKFVAGGPPAPPPRRPPPPYPHSRSGRGTRSVGADLADVAQGR